MVIYPLFSINKENIISFTYNAEDIVMLYLGDVKVNSDISIAKQNSK